MSQTDHVADESIDSSEEQSPASRWQFGLSNLFWLPIVSAILILWYQDHQRLVDQMATSNGRSSWSVQQVLGKPNTPVAGDVPTAWASQGQDTGMEWLIVEFSTNVIATGALIEASYNPGAVCRVCEVDWKGRETELWKGTDPTPRTAARGTSKIQFDAPVKTRRIKVYLDSAQVPGWNEIDAVALVDENNLKQWATDAWASSSFGDNKALPEWFWP